MKKILITGATGHLGKDVVAYLLHKIEASNLAVLVRDKAKVADLEAKGVAVRVGDYDDYDSLVQAFTGVEKVYFISGSDIAKRLTQHENVVKAAQKAGVEHIVYTSFVRKNETETSPIAFISDSHIKTENWIVQSGMHYTILKHAIYADTIPMFGGEHLLDSGVFYFPAGDGKVGFTLRKDMAEFAATILTSGGHENKFYDVTNEETVTFSEIAKLISESTGKSIVYVSPSQEEYTKTLADAGVPTAYIGMFAGFAEAFKQGEFEAVNTVFESVVGRKPTPVAEFLKGVYS